MSSFSKQFDLLIREVFDMMLARLLTASIRVDSLQTSCDVCEENGVDGQPAVSYCITCSRKMCTKHDEVQ